MQHIFPYPATITPGKVVWFFLALLAPALTLPAKETFFHYLQQSASQGEAESQFILGVAYRDGWDGTIKPGTVAARWREVAAELDDQRPELVFGLLQKGDDRVLPDKAKALECLTQAAGQGDNYACVLLGEMYLEGNGVAANWRSGVEWIRKSAVTGFHPAQFRLGIIYLVGDVCAPKNEIEALAWFIIAAEGGSRPAERFRDERTRMLGREAALLAIKRSRALLGKDSAESAGGD